MNIFKSWYYNFLDYRDESQECFINRKGKIVAIVDMLSIIQYWFYSIFYTKTNKVDFGKEDYFRLYPKKAKKLTFVSYKDLSTDSEDSWTLKDILWSDKNNYTLYDILNKIQK